MLADLPVGDILVRKADGGRRPKAIREISVQRAGNLDLIAESRAMRVFQRKVGFTLPKKKERHDNDQDSETGIARSGD
jgi:hypothetical protein